MAIPVLTGEAPAASTDKRAASQRLPSRSQHRGALLRHSLRPRIAPLRPTGCKFGRGDHWKSR